MEIQPPGARGCTPVSPSSTATSSSSAHAPPNPDANPMQSWWESLSKARSRIHSLASLLPSPSPAVSSLADSDRPARSLLESPEAYLSLSSPLSSSSAGSGSDPLCHWLYDTFLSSDPDLRLVVLSFVPLLSGLYLSRIVSSPAPSLSGFEAVLLALYSSEVKSRNGKPLTVSVPDLSLPSLYHSPRPASGPRPPAPPPHPDAGVLCSPLEPQIAVRSTKRACVVAVALDCYYKKISQMPPHSKLDFCEFVTAWAGQDCACCDELDRDPDTNCSSESSASCEIRAFEDDDAADITIEDSTDMTNKLANTDGGNKECRGCRVPLPWELLQPILRILGHCLLGPLNPQEVKDAASIAARAVYARASHDLLPQAILASRSLIRLDMSSRLAEKAAAVAVTGSASNPNTPTKPRKPEILLVSK